MHFVGNQKIANFLKSSFENGSFSHAYCLVGLSKIGKRTLANVLAAKILATDVEKLRLNPDYVFIERLEDEKTNKKKKEISVEQVRELRDKIFQSAWGNGYKVAVIDEAELLNEESGNALLKVLEEPPAKSIIFLLTENDNLLLPTVRSRCQVLQLTAVNDQEIKDWLLLLEGEASLVDEIVKLSWGRPGKAKTLLENSEIYSQHFEEQIRFEKILKAPVYERWQLVEDLLSEKGGLVKTKEKLEPILEGWIMFWRTMMVTDLDQAPKFQNNIDQTNKIKNLLAVNVNPKLAIEQLLTTI